MITRLIAEILRTSPKSVLILGPRQVGKSTLLHGLKPDLSINLADQNEYLIFTAHANELIHRIHASRPRTVFIDEIQRIPDLLNTIQVLSDDKKNKLKFYLSGSSARKLRRGAANLLPGRLFNFRLGPVSCLELNGKMDSMKALSVGCMPEPYTLTDLKIATKLLSSYSGTYLQEEIMNESIVRQVHGFSRFLKIVATNSGSWLDFSKLAHKSKVNRSAARRYYEILEDTLICDKIEAYSGEEELDLVKHPKFYLFDVGVVNALVDNFTPSQDRLGLLFEHLFFNQLKNTSYALDINTEISHFRTRGGLEVDFIVKLKRRLVAVEVKVSEPSSEELLPLKKLISYSDFKSCERYVACLSTSPKKIDGIFILPWQEVIRRIFI